MISLLYESSYTILRKRTLKILGFKSEKHIYSF